MREFKSYGDNVKLPSEEECRALLEEYNTPLHVVKHCEGVMDFAVKFANLINENSDNNNGLTVNVDMVKKACMIHDILRVVDFYQLEKNSFMQEVTDEDIKIWNEQIQKFRQTDKSISNHPRAAYEVLKEKYPELAMCIWRHDYKMIGDTKGWLIEDYIVSYIDKRVRDDGAITLMQRFSNGGETFIELLRNQGATDEEIENIMKEKDFLDGEYVKLEKELFALAGVDDY